MTDGRCRSLGRRASAEAEPRREHTGSPEPARDTHLPAASTTKELSDRKSNPKMGRSTPASRNSQVKAESPNCKETQRVPQEGIALPLAADSLGPVGAERELWGSTERLAPVSTKNRSPEMLSWRYNKDEAEVTEANCGSGCDRRRTRFPTRSRGAHTSSRSQPISHGRSTHELVWQSGRVRNEAESDLWQL